MNTKYWFYYDIIANMLSNKKNKSLRNWTNWTILYKQFSCFYHIVLFCCAKNITLNSTHYLIMKIPNKQVLQQIAFNHLSDIEFKELMNCHRKYTARPLR